MTAPTFTVLLPVVRPPDLMIHAVRSVLTQTRQDFELFIVCDGAPAETVATARTLAADDPRIRVFCHPKGERHGEVWRHHALQQAHGRLVCHIADDDLWFPNHLAEMDTLLSAVEFGNCLFVELSARDQLRLSLADLSEGKTARKMLTERYNIFGLSAGGYRLDSYHALPEGWAPASEDIWTDLAMWRKFLARPGLTRATRFTATVLKFNKRLRETWPLQDRAAEMVRYSAALHDPVARDGLVQTAMRYAARQYTRTKDREADLKDRLTERDPGAET